MSKIIEIAEKEIGYTETPKNTNKTKFGKWFGLNGLPWCGIFVSWVYNKAGKPIGNIGYTNGFAGCQTAVAYFKKNKKVIPTPIPGCIVFFDWNSDNRYDHVGIFVRQVDQDTVETIEGNTSLSNNSNGGQVMRRYRNLNTKLLFVLP